MNHCVTGATHRLRVTGTLYGRGWGSGTFTDDSVVAMVAVHAGVVSDGATQEVLATCVANPGSYTGSTANSVTTESYGSWPSAFSLSAPPAASAVPCEGSCLHNACLITGEVKYLTVTGRTNGLIWGSSIYSDDSDVPTAAVHHGLVAPGETKQIKAICTGAQTTYEASTNAGITSAAYGAWPLSYTLE